MKRNQMKRGVAAVLLLCMLALALVGCNGGTTDDTDAVPGGNDSAGVAAGANPDAVVNAYWAAAMKGDTEAANALVVGGQQAEIAIMEEDMFGEDEAMEEFGEAFIDRFDIEATDYEIDGDTATVDVTVTIPDLSTVFADYFEEVMTTMMDMAMNEATDEEIAEASQELLLDALKDADDMTFEETAELQKVDGEWKIMTWNFDGLEASMEGVMSDFADSMME